VAVKIAHGLDEPSTVAPTKLSRVRKSSHKSLLL